MIEIAFDEIEHVDDRVETWSKFGFDKAARATSLLLEDGRRIHLSFQILGDEKKFRDFDVAAHVIASRAEVPYHEHGEVRNKSWFWISPTGSPSWDQVES